MPKEINPKAIATEDIQILLRFFESQAAIGVKIWKKETTYTFATGDQFSFTHDLYQQEKKGKPGILFCVQIISNDEELGKGAFGTVKALEGNLAFFSTGVRFKERSNKGNSRVVKIQSHHPITNPRIFLDNEYYAASRSGHCAIKEPVVSDSSPQCTSYLTLRRFPGEDLFGIILRGRLTTPERIALSKGLLLALKTQIKDIDLVHRDIKPENIIVDMGSPMKINIIDFAYCGIAGTDDTSSPGTAAYAAPEIFQRGKKKILFNSDIYSMGRVLALLWNLNYASYCNTSTHIVLTPEAKLEGLFSGITDLDLTVKDLIKHTLMGMLNNDLAMRLSLDDAITAFSRIGVSGTEPVLIDAAAGADVPPTTSDAGAAPTTFSEAISAFGLMATPQNPRVVNTLALPHSSLYDLSESSLWGLGCSIT